MQYISLLKDNNNTKSATDGADIWLVALLKEPKEKTRI